MRRELHAVSVLATGSFLPNDPVPNDRIDDILGPLDQAPPRVQTFVENVGTRMRDASGIEFRHFAVAPETRRLTHDNASMAAEAARRALETAGRRPSDVDLLIISSPTPDATTPPTSALLQERLGIERCAEMEIHSNCSGVGKGVQVAFDALRVGRYKTALVTYVQISSAYLRSSYFSQARMNKTQAALRYILADGAGAILLEAADLDHDVPHEVIGTHIESVGGNEPPAMTAGGGITALMENGYPGVMIEQGSHHLDQDFSAVNRYAGPRLLDGMRRMLKDVDIDPFKVDHFVGSIPTRQLYDSNFERFSEFFGGRPDCLKFRARNTGYCGGASILLHFDEMVRGGELKPGQICVLHSVESSKWMTGGFVVRW
ncbi:MAG: hypothetical protein JXO22_15480 [Phycisphaerae bacterium]|nr:hypothetical protein [Phycisphaerae bacterium]